MQTLHAMAATAARNAERVCSQPGGSGNGLPFQNYVGYPFYIDEFNHLVELAARIEPEVGQYFLKIDLGTDRNPFGISGPLWKSYSELAVLRLNSLANYLKSKLGLKEKEHEQIIDLINANLRPAFHNDPTNERDVQDMLETIFRVRMLDYRREKGHRSVFIKTLYSRLHL
jgi:hypothetical protein